MIVCVLLPRFELTVAAGDRHELLKRPVALAPEPGGVQRVGQVSLPAEAFGIHPGMALGEALARCPRLMLLPPDPVGVADRWERSLVRLESIGAAVEPDRPGLGCFEARGLLRLHGGIDGVLAATRRALRLPARYGVAPSRFAAVVAASQARVRRPVIVGRRADLLHHRLVSDDRVDVRAYLAPMPVKLLRARPELAELPGTLERLGVHTLGELASIPPATLTDRFGKLGRYAHQLATGTDVVLRPRVASEWVRESLELPEAATGPALEQALELLIDRLLARPERRGRTVRAVVLSAVLVENGGGWREQVAFREALADPVRMRLALAPRLHSIPAPADELRVAVERFGPPAGDQRPLVEDPTAARMARLREAIRQARAAAGPEAALRVLEVDPDSRFPERRAVLAPFEG
jgi:protein ImuB